MERRIKAIGRQVDSLLVVNNGPIGHTQMQRGEPVCSAILMWVQCDGNRGLGWAQNVGIRAAVRQGATHVVLFDQDSLPAPNMVSRLYVAERELGVLKVPVAALAPVYVDARQADRRSFFRLGRWGMKRFGCDGRQHVVETDAAIASGSMIPVEALTAIGLMREDFFIDLIDIEWHLRARAQGYRSFGVCDALLEHSLGETPRQLFGRSVTHHPPSRTYYFFRNAFWLMKQDYVPVGWKLAVVRQLLRRYVLYALLITPRWKYFRMMSRGILDGLLSRLGPLDGVHD